MGYAHYWRRTPDLTPADFLKAADDIREILVVALSKGMKLAGPTGYGKPELTKDRIAFNGAHDCGHPQRDLGKPWPSKGATGVEEMENPVVGPWYSGALLGTRTCGGDCSGEAFTVDRVFKMRDWDQLEDGKNFQSCTTNYKPYDLPVTAALVRLKERMGATVVVSSDGGLQGFIDGQLLCVKLFGPLEKFELELEDPEVI